MADPIEDFLRRAAQLRRQKARSDDEIIDAEVIEDDEPDIYIGSVVETEGEITEQIARPVGSTDFEQRALRLGAAVDASDDRMEAHLHEVFEHRLGDLGVTTSRAADSTLDDDTVTSVPATGFDVRSWLQSPHNLRSAILLNEILQRPEYRW